MHVNLWYFESELQNLKCHSFSNLGQSRGLTRREANNEQFCCWLIIPSRQKKILQSMNKIWGDSTWVGLSWLSRVLNWLLGSPSSSSTVAQKANWTRLRRGPSFMWETRRWKTSWSVFWIAQSKAEKAESADLATGSKLQKIPFSTWY